MNSNSIILFVAPLFLLAACTVTGPADDGFENSQEYVNIGRLGRDDGEAYTFYSTEKENKNDQANSSSQSGLDLSEYQLWREARENESDDYQKFIKWKEYEAFDEWKEQQKSSN